MVILCGCHVCDRPTNSVFLCAFDSETKHQIKLEFKKAVRPRDYCLDIFLQLSKQFPDKSIKEIVITRHEFETKELEEIESLQTDYPISVLKNFSKAKLVHIFSFLKKQLLEGENVTVISVNNFQVEFQLFKFFNDEIVPFKYEQNSELIVQILDSFLDGKKCTKFIVYYLNDDELGQIKRALKGKRVKFVQINKFDMANGALLMIRRNTLGEIGIYDVGKFNCNVGEDEKVPDVDDSDFEIISEDFEDSNHEDVRQEADNSTSLPIFYSNLFEIPENNSNEAVIFDFGTTFTRIFLPNDLHYTFYSVFTLELPNPTTVFIDPKEMTPNLLRNSVFDLKKIIGKKFFQVEQDPIWPFHVAFPEIDQVSIQFKNGKIPPMKPEFILAKILSQFGSSGSIILTIPTFFSEEQKLAIFEAAKIAEFSKIFLVDDLTTKLMTICAKNGIERNGKILMIDIGGGKTDVAVFDQNFQKLSKSLPDECENYFVGGRNFDNVLFDYFLKQIVDEDEREQFISDCFKKFQLWQFCQKIKESYRDDVDIQFAVGKKVEIFVITKLQNAQLKILKAKNTQKHHTKKRPVYILESFSLEAIPAPIEQFSINSEQIEANFSEIVTKIEGLIVEKVSSSETTPDEIETVILIGGCTKMPNIQKMISELFPLSKIMNFSDENLLQDFDMTKIKSYI